jgi:thymidylate kinase
VDEFSYGQAKDIVSDIGFTRPDIVFLLDLPAEVACARKQEQKKKEGVPPDRYDLDVDYLSKVRNRFLMLKEDSFLCSRWVVLDATRPVEEIHTEILMMLKGQK